MRDRTGELFRLQEYDFWRLQKDVHQSQDLLWSVRSEDGSDTGSPVKLSHSATVLLSILSSFFRFHGIKFLAILLIIYSECHLCDSNLSNTNLQHIHNKYVHRCRPLISWDSTLEIPKYFNNNNFGLLCYQANQSPASDCISVEFVWDKVEKVRDETSTADPPTFTKLTDASFVSFRDCSHRGSLKVPHSISSQVLLTGSTANFHPTRIYGRPASIHSHHV